MRVVQPGQFPWDVDGAEVSVAHGRAGDPWLADAKAPTQDRRLPRPESPAEVLQRAIARDAQTPAAPFVRHLVRHQVVRHQGVAPAGLAGDLAAAFPSGGRDRQSGLFIVSDRKRGPLITSVTTDLAASAHRVLTEGQQEIVYFETFVDVLNAVYRDRCIRGWRRQTQIDLIESINPGWDDLSPEIFA